MIFRDLIHINYYIQSTRLRVWQFLEGRVVDFLSGKGFLCELK